MYHDMHVIQQWDEDHRARIATVLIYMNTTSSSFT